MKTNLLILLAAVLLLVALTGCVSEVVYASTASMPSSSVATYPVTSDIVTSRVVYEPGSMPSSSLPVAGSDVTTQTSQTPERDAEGY